MLYEIASPFTGQTYQFEADAEPAPEDIEHIGREFDAEAARAAGVDPAVLQQGPAGTLVNTVRNIGPEFIDMTVGGVAKLNEAIGRSPLAALSPVGMAGQVVQGMAGLKQSPLATVADATRVIRETGEAMRPVNPFNETARTVGGAVNQIGGMVATGGLGVAAGMAPQAAMKAIPAAVGFAAGAGQGVDTAQEMGITSPTAQAAMGGAFGAVEMLTEKIGGIGGDVVDRFVRPSSMLGRAALNVASESGEEVLAGRAQDALTVAAGQTVADPQRPGFTQSGYQLPSLNPLNPDTLNRMKQEAIGGAAGGVIFSGLQMAANRSNPNELPTPQTPGTPPTSNATASLGDLAGAPDRQAPEEHTGDLTAADVADMERPRVPGFTDPAAGVMQLDPQADLGRDFQLKQQAPAFRDNPFAQPQEASGNVITDLRIPRSPEAIAESQRFEQDRLTQQARLRNLEAKTGRGPLIPDSPLGSYDILDFVNENRIRMPKAGAARGGEYDWTETYSVPPYYRQFLGNTESGSSIDQVAQMAFENGFIREPTPDALMAAVSETISARKQYRVEFAKQAREQQQAERRALDFEKTQGQLRNKDKGRVMFEDIAPGDNLTIDGEPVVVSRVDYDEDGYLTNVVLQDGKRFGVMQFDPQARSGLFVDEWQPGSQRGQSFPSRPFPTAAVAANAAAVASGRQAPEVSRALQAMTRPGSPPAPPAGTRKGLGAGALFQTQVSGSKSQVSSSGLAAAYAAVSQGQSSGFVPLGTLLQQMQQANPALTAEDFAAEIKRAYDANELYLEGANTQQEVQASGFAIEGTPVGTAVRVAFPQRSFASRTEPGNAPQKDRYTLLREVRSLGWMDETTLAKARKVLMADQPRMHVYADLINLDKNQSNIALANAIIKAGQRFAENADVDPRDYFFNPDGGTFASRPAPGHVAAQQANQITEPELRRAVALGTRIWDQVWGPLKKPIRFKPAQNPANNGLFTPTDGAHDEIELSRHEAGQDEDAITVIHELAHAQDSTGLQTMDSENPQPGTPMARLMAELNENLPTAQKLNAAAAQWAAMPDKTPTEQAVADHLAYLARPEERFARAVEQVTRWLIQGRVLTGEGGFYESGYLTVAEMERILPLLHEILGHGTQSARLSPAQNQPGGSKASPGARQRPSRPGPASGGSTGNDGGRNEGLSGQPAETVAPNETQSRFASPNPADRVINGPRTDAIVADEARQWLDSLDTQAAIEAFVNQQVPLPLDAAEHAAAVLIARLSEQATSGKTEVARMWAHAQGLRMARVWTKEFLSADPARALRQRGVVNNTILAPIAPVLAAQEMLEDRGKKVIDQRFDGGTDGAVEKTKAVVKKADQQAGEELAAKLGDDATDEVPELGENPDVAPVNDARIAELEKRLKELREQMTTADAAADATLRETSTTWQKILSVLNSASQRKSSLLNGVKGRVAALRKAAMERKAKRRAEGRLNTNPVEDFADDVIIGASLLAEGIVEFSNWSQALIREIGARSAPDLRKLYAEASKQYLALLEAEKAAPTKRKAKPRSAAESGARQKVNRAQRTAQNILDSLSRRYSDPPIFQEGQRKVNEMRELYKQRVKTGMAETEFVAKAKTLGANEGTAGILWEASNLEIEAREIIAREKEREKLYQLALQDKSLATVLDALRKKLYPGLKWADIFMELPDTQKARQLEIYRRLKLDTRLDKLTANDRLALTNELDKAWQRERRKVFLRELEKAGVMGEKKPKDREKVKAAAPRLLRLMNLGLLNSEMFREALAREYGLSVIDAKTAAELRALGERIQQAPEGLPRRKLEIDLMERLQRLTKSTFLQILDSYWTASVLSGWRTQVDIGLSLLNGIEDVGLGSVVTALRTGNKDVAVRALGALFGRLPSAFLEAVDHIATGNKTLIRNFELEAKQALENGNRLASDVGSELWNRGGWRKVPGGFMIFYGRVITALDHLNAASTMQGAKMLALARHPELYQKALKITPADRAAALAQAKLEMLGGAEPANQSERLEVAARQREILERETPVEVLNEATEVGRRAALQGDPTGLGGGLLDMLNGALAMVNRKAQAMAGRENPDALAVQTAKITAWAVPLLRVLTGTKFVRTAAHALNRTTSYVPGVGFYTVGQQGRTGVFGDILMARQVIGTLAGLALYLAFDDDDDERGIEDSWRDKTPQEKAQLYAQGKQPFTVWERDAQGRVVGYNYQQWGLAGIINTVAAMLKRKNSPDGWANVLAASLAQGMLSFTDKAQLQGLQTVLGENFRSTDPVSGVASNLNKYVAQTVGGFVPRLLKDIDLVAHPELHSSSEWWQKWAKEVPMVRELSSGKRVNIFGEDILLDRGPMSRVMQIGTADPDYRLLARLNAKDLYLPDPTNGVRVVKRADGTRRDMTPAEKDRYQRLTGQAYRQFVREQAENLLRMEHEEAKTLISRRTERLRDIAAYQATH